MFPEDSNYGAKFVETPAATTAPAFGCQKEITLYDVFSLLGQIPVRFVLLRLRVSFVFALHHWLSSI